jgi:hypothetical protein
MELCAVLDALVPHGSCGAVGPRDALMGLIVSDGRAFAEAKAPAVGFHSPTLSVRAALVPARSGRLAVFVRACSGHRSDWCVAALVPHADDVVVADPRMVLVAAKRSGRSPTLEVVIHPLGAISYDRAEPSSSPFRGQRREVGMPLVQIGTHAAGLRNFPRIAKREPCCVWVFIGNPNVHHVHHVHHVLARDAVGLFSESVRRTRFQNQALSGKPLGSLLRRDLSAVCCRQSAVKAFRTLAPALVIS